MPHVHAAISEIEVALLEIATSFAARRTSFVSSNFWLRESIWVTLFFFSTDNETKCLLFIANFFLFFVCSQRTLFLKQFLWHCSWSQKVCYRRQNLVITGTRPGPSTPWSRQKERIRNFLRSHLLSKDKLPATLRRVSFVLFLIPHSNANFLPVALTSVLICHQWSNTPHFWKFGWYPQLWTSQKFNKCWT